MAKLKDFFIIVCNGLTNLFLLLILLAAAQWFSSGAVINLGSFLLMSCVVWLIFLLLFNGFTVTWHFDKVFKSDVLIKSSQDRLIDVVPFAGKNILYIRIFRGALYLGGVLFYCLPFIRPAFFTQQYLLKNTKFIEKITLRLKIQALLTYASYLITAIVGIISFIFYVIFS